MKIHSLQLYQFRNYRDKNWIFDKDIVVLYGDNGVGKTNLLEALYVGTIGRSHRTNDVTDLLHYGVEEASIIVGFSKQETKQEIIIKLAGRGPKDIKLNGDKVSRKELLGCLHTVLFCPEDLQLIKNNPADRRRFIDMELSQTSVSYYQQYLTYHKALKQRNRLLKEMKVKGKSYSLEEWNQQLAESGSFLIKKRLESLKKINLLLDLMNRRLTGGKENLSIHYIQPYRSKEGFIVESKDLLALLHEREDEDRERLSTSVGPHRDDLGFFMDGKDLKRYGSQGQQRTAILSLKLSEVEFIKSEIGEYPILLLDDVLSELDRERRDNLLSYIHRRIQTFITTTEYDEFERLQDVQYIPCVKVGEFCESN